jgi:hypothetical protein
MIWIRMRREQARLSLRERTQFNEEAMTRVTTQEPSLPSSFIHIRPPSSGSLTLPMS